MFATVSCLTALVLAVVGQIEIDNSDDRQARGACKPFISNIFFIIKPTLVVII